MRIQNSTRWTKKNLTGSSARTHDVYPAEISMNSYNPFFVTSPETGKKKTTRMNLFTYAISTFKHGSVSSILFNDLLKNHPFKLFINDVTFIIQSDRLFTLVPLYFLASDITHQKATSFSEQPFFACKRKEVVQVFYSANEVQRDVKSQAK